MVTTYHMLIWWYRWQSVERDYECSVWIDNNIINRHLGCRIRQFQVLCEAS